MKTYSFRIITFVFILLFAFACKEDSLIIEPIVLSGTGSVSGTVLIDLDGDGLPDNPGQRATVYYTDFPIDSLNILNGLSTMIDSNGFYTFDSLPPDSNKILHVDYSPYKIQGTDNTPDGDPMETETQAFIHVELVDGEIDDGNDFVIEQYQTAVTGRVLEDLDGDGIGDVPLEGATIDLYLRQSNGQPVSARTDAADSDADGNFEIYHPSPAAYVLQIKDIPGFMVLSGTDTSPDPDGIGDPTMPNLIPVDLEDFEKDADNVFTVKAVKRSTISGQVLEDIDDDLIGDLPVEQHRIELYFRNASGVPTSSTGGPVQAMNSDADGNFRFEDMEPGEYVLYHIGTGNYPYHCVKGSDLTPEPGEPTVHPDCIFIQVDILDDTAQDFDNTFVIKKD